MSKLLCLCLLALLSIQNISSCNSESDSDKIKNTVHKALKAINLKDYKNMQGIMGIYSPSDTCMEIIASKVNRVDYFIDKYFDGNISKLTVKYAKTLDGLGRLEITIPLFNGYDSTTGTLEANLYFYIGPPAPVPLSKLSGFDFDAKYDGARTRQLDLEGKLPNFDEPIGK